MSESSNRMTKRDKPPNDSDIAEWIGRDAYAYWKNVIQLIDHNYPDVFKPEWLYGGQRHGWSLRYKKSKSFCTFIPERNRFALLIVFGADERARVEAIRDRLSSGSLNEYDKAVTYHDGKWVLLTVDNTAVVKDVEMLLAVKRRPKN